MVIEMTFMTLVERQVLVGNLVTLNCGNISVNNTKGCNTKRLLSLHDNLKRY